MMQLKQYILMGIMLMVIIFPQLLYLALVKAKGEKLLFFINY